jgi:hypothetical protein
VGGAAMEEGGQCKGMKRETSKQATAFTLIELLVVACLGPRQDPSRGCSLYEQQ